MHPQSKAHTRATKKKTLTFQSTGCLIEILVIMVYYNPDIAVWYNPLYTLKTTVFDGSLSHIIYSNNGLLSHHITG